MRTGSGDLSRDGINGQVRDVVGAIVDVVRRTGLTSAGALGSAVDLPLRALTRRIATESVADPRPVADSGRLASELRRHRGSMVTGGATAAVAAAGRVARRFGPLRFLARRGPTWLLAAGVPALYSSVMLGTEEIRLVASHLVLRARAAGNRPDPERVARATVQVLTGRPVDAATDPDHGRLVSAWLQRAVRAALPMGRGVSTPDPDRLAAAAASVDTSLVTAGAVLPASSRPKP